MGSSRKAWLEGDDRARYVAYLLPKHGLEIGQGRVEDLTLSREEAQPVDISPQLHRRVDADAKQEWRVALCVTGHGGQVTGGAHTGPVIGRASIHGQGQG